jgi:CheY-like chemotaxis protein
MKNGGSILLVEDDADDVYFISRALRNSGLDAPLNVVTDGSAAVEFLTRAGERLDEPEASPPALVLLDLNLPRKSGLDVLKWIRQESVLKTIVVIVLTSSTSDADMNRAYLLGANSYIIKPSDATKLKELGQLLKAYWLGWNQTPPVCRSGATAAFA